MQIQFLAIGELLADMVTTDFCESLEEAQSFNLLQGGSPSNVTANLRWLGKEAELVAAVGDDGIGRFLLSEIKKTGISGKHVRIIKEQPTSLVLVTKSRSTPDFIPYRAADTHIKTIEEELLKNAQVLHTTAFALSKEPARQTILNAFVNAQYEKILSVDWNFSPAIWGNDEGREVFQKLMSLQPLLKISMDDIERFADIKDVLSAKNYLDKYNSTICLTVGKDGVFYKGSDLSWQHAEAVKVDQVKDTTGAGDAFWAGFLSGVIDKLPIDDCVRTGLRIASEKIQKQGPLYAN